VSLSVFAITIVAATPITAPVPTIITSLSVSTLNGSSDELCEKDKLQNRTIEKAVKEMVLRKFISKVNNDKLNCFVLRKV
jgi:hypothetical protein